MRLIANTLVVIGSPLAMLLLFVAACALAFHAPEWRLAIMLSTLPIWLGLTARWQGKPQGASLSHWLIGQYRVTNRLAAMGLITLGLMDLAAAERRRYPPLRIAVHKGARDSSWTITIQNRGWRPVGPVYVSAADLAQLIAPGWLAHEIVAPDVVEQRVPPIKTGILLPLMKVTVERQVLPGFEAASSSLMAMFFVHGGNELTSALYRLDVAHLGDHDVAPDPGPDKRHPPPPELHFEYESACNVPVFAQLPDGSPYSGKAFGSHGIVDWSGSFVEGKPDGEFSVVLGDRVSLKERYSMGKPPR